MTTNPDPVAPKSLYQVYDKDWVRVGFSVSASYPGQMPVTHAFPLKCPKCGRGIEGIGTPGWLAFRGIGPSEAHQSRHPSVAWCSGQHVIERVPVAQLMKDQDDAE